MSLKDICTFYKNVVERPYKSSKQLSTPGRLVSMLELLTNERYTNNDLLTKLRLSGYKSDFYNSNKSGLSAATFSTVQDDLTIDRSDANTLYHTGYISFDIDVDKNPYLLTDPESIRDFIIDNIPYVAYLGKSVSNIGYWGLIPILNKDDHYGHYAAMKELFAKHEIILDKTSDISRLRFIAYDPDGYINDDAQIYTESLAVETNNNYIENYERKATDEFFIAACRWIEAKHEITFQKGSIHNYLLYLYGTLRGCHISRENALNWIYNNLIDESQITTNCLDEPKWIKKQ